MDIDFAKYTDGLVPGIVQDSGTGRVLMLGFMNREALELTRSSGNVVFYSRSRQRLWMKGETSGNYLKVEEVLTDCDSDTILVKAVPQGPVCHTGRDTCFGEENAEKDFLYELENVIKDRKTSPINDSYTSGLFRAGLNRVAQKVGEEAVELVIESMDRDVDRFKDEAADLLYHLLVLLVEKDVPLSDVVRTLKRRAA